MGCTLSLNKDRKDDLDDLDKDKNDTKNDGLKNDLKNDGLKNDGLKKGKLINQNINISSIELSSKTISLFKNYTYDTTLRFNKMFENKILIGRVVDIYDGDTITCVINVFNGFFLFNIRLGDIDTCEIKSKMAKCQELSYKARYRMFELITKTKINLKEQKHPLKIKNLLSDQLNVYLINILCGSFDKYGRLLGWIFDTTDKDCYKSNSYNHILLREKLAYEYNGSTKLTEEQQIKLLV
jgi:endonuclease YncB( thermonuclease family)